MWWSREPDPNDEAARSGPYLDRLSIVVAAAAYVGLLIYLILSVVGVIPEVSWNFGRRYTMFVVTDEGMLLLFGGMAVILVAMWTYRYFKNRQ